MSRVRHLWNFRGQDNTQPDGRLVSGASVPGVEEKNVGPLDSDFFLNYIDWEGGGLVQLPGFQVHLSVALRLRVTLLTTQAQLSCRHWVLISIAPRCPLCGYPSAAG